MLTQDENRILSTKGSLPQIRPEQIVAEVLAAWPATIPVFLKHRLGCVGCAMSSFDTLADVARIYRIDSRRFLEEIQAAVRSSPEALGSGCPEE